MGHARTARWAGGAALRAPLASSRAGAVAIAAMSSPQITLEGTQIVLSGDFAEITADDAKWGLIARGARVMASVGQRTTALVAGTKAKPALLAKAAEHGTPVLDEPALRALLDGVPLREVLLAAKGAPVRTPPRDDLAGLRVAVSGAIAGLSQVAIKAALEARGATVVRKASPSVDLVLLGAKYGADAIEAMDEGVPFLRAEALERLLEGAPLTDFVGAPTSEGADDPAQRMLAIVESVRERLLAVGDLEGEVWSETLSLTLRPGGRVRAGLIHLDGTPIHDHVRTVLHAQRWPAVAEPVTIEVPLVFQ